MFRIRRIDESVLPSEKSELAQVQAILREQFPGIEPEDILQLTDELRDPMLYRYRTMVFTATGGHGRVKGFAILLHLPDLHFCYLDYISAARLVVGRGVGGALYARVREESLALGSVGLFFECPPDEPVEGRRACVGIERAVHFAACFADVLERTAGIREHGRKARCEGLGDTQAERLVWAGVH
mgnify:CR=1 FL=1